jgi:hypothetical protein
MKIKLIALTFLLSYCGLSTANISKAMTIPLAAKRGPDSALSVADVISSMKYDIISDNGLENLIQEAQTNFTQKWNAAKAEGNFTSSAYLDAAMRLRVLIQLKECRNQKK